MAAAAAAAASNSSHDEHNRDFRDSGRAPRMSTRDLGYGTHETDNSLLHNIVPLSTPRSNAVESPSMRKLEQDLMNELSRQLQMQEALTDNHGHWLVENLPFKATIMFLVLLNAILMGVEVDYPELKDTWKVTDHIFGAAFFLEMILKIVVLRLDYFRDRWNLLDGTLAMMGFMDTWFVTIIGGSNIGLSQFSILRILRLLRLVRLARLFRQFGKLVIVMRSIAEAIETTFWVAAVLCVCIYVCAIFCVDFIGNAPEGTYPGYSEVEDVIDEQEVMQNFNPHIVFGNMSTAMVSLFNIAILAEWTEIVRPVLLKQPAMVLFFIGFCIFVCFGVMNVIIGMIVDSVIQNARQLEREFEEVRRKEKVEILQQLKDVIFQVDSSGDFEIDVDEVEKVLNGDDPRLQEIMQKVSLPYGCSADEFMALLDNSGDGKIQHDEFVQSMYRLINCSGFQQTCLIQIGVNKLMYSMNILSAGLEKLHQQQSKLLKQQDGKLTASNVHGKAPNFDASTQRPDLASCLEAVCAEVSKTVHCKLREELGQSLERVLAAGPKSAHVDGATPSAVAIGNMYSGQWEVMEDQLHKLASDVPTDRFKGHVSPHKATGAEIVQPSVPAYPFNAPTEEPSDVLVESVTPVDSPRAGKVDSTKVDTMSDRNHSEEVATKISSNSIADRSAAGNDAASPLALNGF